MPRLFKKSDKKAGLAPGTLIHVGNHEAEEVCLDVVDYDEGKYSEQRIESVEQCLGFKDTPTVTWLNVAGLNDLRIIEDIGKDFAIHPLILEDILNTNQRPKFEDCDDYIFVTLKMFRYEQAQAYFEQVSFLLGSTFVISFQETNNDIFAPVKDRIKNTRWRIRKLGADYLLYALIDCIVDNYFVFLERMADRIEILQDQVAGNPTEDNLSQIYDIKREMVHFRKSVWPMREIANSMVANESNLIKDSTHIYLRDVYDHVIQVIDATETYREMISVMLDVYLSSISNKMNTVMKVLTIIATIFIPLTFIAGIYGMNFQHMPELAWPWAYPTLWVVMVVIFVTMVFYFKKKKWL